MSESAASSSKKRSTSFRLFRRNSSVRKLEKKQQSWRIRRRSVETDAAIKYHIQSDIDKAVSSPTRKKAKTGGTTTPNLTPESSPQRSNNKSHGERKIDSSSSSSEQERHKKKKKSDKNNAVIEEESNDSNDSNDDNSIPEIICHDEYSEDDVSRMTPTDFYWKLQFDDFNPRAESLVSSQKHQQKEKERNDDDTVPIEEDSHSYSTTESQIEGGDSSKFHAIAIVLFLWVIISVTLNRTLSIAVVPLNSQSMWTETIIPKIRVAMMPFYRSFVSEIQSQEAKSFRKKARIVSRQMMPRKRRMKRKQRRRRKHRTDAVWSSSLSQSTYRHLSLYHTCKWNKSNNHLSFLTDPKFVQKQRLYTCSSDDAHK